MRATRSVGPSLPVVMILVMGIVLSPASVNGQVAQRGPDLPANKSTSRSGANVKLQFVPGLPTTDRIEPEHFEIFNDDQPAVVSSGILGPTGGETRAESPVLLHGPDAFKIFREVVLSPSGTNKDNNEPAVANSGDYVFYTGNKYAARSTDGGQTWAYVDPFRDFENFCCDQDVVYDRKNDLLIWFRLGNLDPANKSNFRLGVSKDGGATFYFWNWRPTHFNNTWTDVGWDHPHLALSDNYLYFTLNAYRPKSAGGGNYRSVLARASLATLKAGSNLSWTYWVQDSAQYGCFSAADKKLSPPAWAPVQGAGKTMFVGQSTTNDCFTVWKQNDGSNILEQYRIKVPRWTVSQIAPNGKSTNLTCKLDDGGDPCQSLDHRVKAGWTAKGRVGFFWNAASGNGFPQPYVNAATFDSRTLSYVGRPYLWNSDYAWAWIAAYPNERGDVGIATWRIGKGLNPQLYVAIDDQLNGEPPPWEVKEVAASKTSTLSNSWGHYLRVRHHSPNNLAWIVSGFVSVNGSAGPGVSEPHFAIFGRARDEASIKGPWRR